MSGFLNNVPTIYSVNVSKTLNQNNGAATVNLFQLTGTVKVTKLYGMLTAKTTLTNMTSVYFALYDGTATNAITKNDGVMSTALVGAIISKSAAATATAGINLAATGTIIDTTIDESFQSFIATKKNTAATYIRFLYTTTDAPIAATMQFFCEYEQVGGAGTLVAV